MFTIYGVEGGYESVQAAPVLDTDELLARLDAKGVRNVHIARALGLPDSRIPEIRKKTRALKLDEAVKLVQTFGLEQAQQASPLPTPIVRLVVRHIAEQLAVSPAENQLEELTQDVRAFGAFVADPKVRRSLEAAEGFFQALRLRRPEFVPASPPGTDPEQPH